MRVALVFPPQWSPDHPHLALPSLAAFLRLTRGDDVRLFDLNLAAYRDLLSPASLERCRARLLAHGAPGPLPGLADDGRIGPLLLEGTRRASPAALDADGAWALLRDRRRFYDIGAALGAHDRLARALALVSLAHAPTWLTLTGLRLRYAAASSCEIARATRDERENPFLALCRQKYAPAVLADDPHLVGISLAGATQLVPAFTLARALREAAPRGPHICLGGPAASMLADALVAGDLAPLFDSIVCHEGEGPLAALLTALEGDHDFARVPNLVYRDGHGTVCRTAIGAPAPAETLPTPDFRGLPLAEYLEPEPLLPLLASRGCPWRRCAFCQHGFTYAARHRARPAALVVHDLQRLAARHRARRVLLVDEALAPPVARALALALRRAGSSVAWAANVRPEARFTPDLLRLMAESGCRQVFAGLESADDRVLRSMDKGTTAAAAAAMLRDAAAAGLWTHVFVLLGFPGETAAEAARTVEFVAGEDAVHSAAFLDQFVLGVRCRVHREPGRYGIVPLVPPEGHDLPLYLDYHEPGGRTATEKADVAARLRALLAARPSWPAWTRLTRGQFFHQLCHHGRDALLGLPQAARAS